MSDLSFHISTAKNRNDFHYERNEERTFATIEDARCHELICAIIEQAAIDWRELDLGRDSFFLANGGHYKVHRSEVRAFFQSKWFEHLLALALPDISPESARAALKIAEPLWRSK